MRSLFIGLGILAFAGCTNVSVKDKPANGSITPSGVYLEAVKRVDPAYPDEVRKAGLQGFVQVQFTILPDGSVSDLLVVRSANPILDRLALDAVSQWKFRPYTPIGGKLEMLQLPFTFALGR